MDEMFVVVGLEITKRYRPAGQHGQCLDVYLPQQRRSKRPLAINVGRHGILRYI